MWPKVGAAVYAELAPKQFGAAAGFSTRDMISGAGHDACYVSRVAPTTMIFVPCAGGISHNEAGSTAPGECAAGAQVRRLNAICARLDALYLSFTA